MLPSDRKRRHNHSANGEETCHYIVLLTNQSVYLLAKSAPVGDLRAVFYDTWLFRAPDLGRFCPWFVNCGAQRIFNRNQSCLKNCMDTFAQRYLTADVHKMTKARLL
jgi:hypothetical protein